MENFDIIYYINLDHRKDRNENILKELDKFPETKNKIKRIPGIAHKVPSCGCCMAHIECYNDFIASDYNTCIIFEDDFIFDRPTEEIQNNLSRFFSSNIEWDCIMFGINYNIIQPSYIDYLAKCINVQTASGYAITKDMCIKLLENTKECVNMLEKGKKHEGKYAIDQIWKSLQPNNNWYVFIPRFGRQRPDYSDIEKRKVDYPDKRPINVNYKYKYVDITEDKPTNNTDEIIKLQLIIEPNLETEWSLNEQKQEFKIRNENMMDDVLNKLFPDISYVSIKLNMSYLKNLNNNIENLLKLFI